MKFILTGNPFRIVLIGILLSVATTVSAAPPITNAGEHMDEVMAQNTLEWTGKMIPSFALDLLTGGKISSDELVGSNYLIYFWFSGCPPCMKTSSHLSKLQKDYVGNRFTILAVNADRYLELETTDEERAAYINKHGYKFPSAHLNKEMNDTYGDIDKFPTFFLVDADGIIRNHRVGYQPLEVLALDIENLLKEQENEEKGIL